MKDTSKVPQCPLILRLHRLMDAFGKSDDERDFYLDRLEGFIIYVDLMKSEQELETLKAELAEHKQRYVMLPKLTFYETKKIMEGFVNEKVYDIDTKEKLLDVIQSKDAKEQFLDFIYDHLTELEKWQQYYQERSRIRIIEWLRNHQFQFVFEEDLELDKGAIEKVKTHLFDTKPPKDVLQARDIIVTKAKTYYSTEALNPRPKRGRPPKQIVKVEVEQQMTTDIYVTVGPHIRPFLYIPDITNTSAITFSSKYDSEEEFLASRNASKQNPMEKWDSLSKKLASLKGVGSSPLDISSLSKIDWSQEDDDDEEDFSENLDKLPKSPKKTTKVEAKEDLPLLAKTTKNKATSLKKSTIKEESAKKIKSTTKEVGSKKTQKPLGKPLVKPAKSVKKEK